jgi:lipoprotein-releasing system permease protein
VRIASFIGLRFLRSKRQTRSVSVVTWISGVGVMLGVTALIVTISVMNGFRENLFLAVTGTMAHVRVVPERGDLSPAEAEALRARLAALPGVVATAPYVSRQGFLRYSEEFRAVVLRGIDPAAEGRVSELARFLRLRPPSLDEEESDGGSGAPNGTDHADSADGAPKGTDGLPSAGAGGEGASAPPQEAGPGGSGGPGMVEREGLGRPGEGPGLKLLRFPPPAGQRAGILLGRPLADALALRIGDELEVISTEQRITPIGPVPLIKRFRLAGLFETGMGGVDEVTAYVHLEIAGRLYRMQGALSGLSVRMAEPQSIDGDALRAALPGYKVTTWSEENRNIFQVMRLEKVGVFLILTLIIVVAFFNIIASLIMLVLEKRKSIAVLKSLGASNGLMRRVFFMQGVWIGAVGTLAGLSLGLAICWALATFDIVELPERVFPLARRLPVRLDLVDLALITGSSFLICMLVTLYPATAAARTRPIENLRNE